MKQADRITVDRLENGIAVLEGKENLKEIPLTAMPQNVGEGDIVVWDGKKFVVDEEETINKKRELFNKQKSLFK